MLDSLEALKSERDSTRSSLNTFKAFATVKDSKAFEDYLEEVILKPYAKVAMLSLFYDKEGFTKAVEKMDNIRRSFSMLRDNVDIETIKSNILELEIMIKEYNKGK